MGSIGNIIPILPILPMNDRYILHPPSLGVNCGYVVFAMVVPT